MSVKRIYKKFPFSPTNSVKMDKTSIALAKLGGTKKRLLDLRNRISEGKLTRELYSFIDMDGSLSNLLGSVSGVAATENVDDQSVRVSQLRVLDKYIADVDKRIAAHKTTLLDTFRNWFSDWKELTNKIRTGLKADYERWMSDPSAFGSTESFNQLKMTVFRHSSWTDMINHLKELNLLINAIPSEDVDKWVNANHKDIIKHLTIFGNSPLVRQCITDRSSKLYSKVHTSMESGRWDLGYLCVDIEQALEVLGEPAIDNRVMHIVEEALDTDKCSLGCALFLRDFIKTVKTHTLMTARSLKYLLNVARREARR